MADLTQTERLLRQQRRQLEKVAKTLATRALPGDALLATSALVDASYSRIARDIATDLVLPRTLRTRQDPLPHDTEAFPAPTGWSRVDPLVGCGNAWDPHQPRSNSKWWAACVARYLSRSPKPSLTRTGTVHSMA